MLSENKPKIFPGEVFAQTSDFDQGMRQLLPRYEELLDAIARCVPPKAKRILELGCGTGALSLRILERCPQAHLIAMDYSPRMLSYAQAKVPVRTTFVQGDFGDWAEGKAIGDVLPGRNQAQIHFDACISSLAIHHLTDAMKLKLFQRIQSVLVAGGCFWNADPVLPESEAIGVIYQSVRQDWAKQQDPTVADLRSRLGTSDTQGHSHQDQLATLATHLQLLQDAGFETIATPWKYYGLAVFGGYPSS